MARMHNTRSQPDLHKKNENVLASASQDGGPASIYHPSGSIAILTPSLCFNTRRRLIEPSRFARSKLPPCTPYRWKTALEGNWPRNRVAEQNLGGEPRSAPCGL